jgi:O-acetyl-ADP-ribose deacetylase (regulator of RNase III)
VCGAIFKAAGQDKLSSECKAIINSEGKRIPTGETRITRGHDLPAKFILHTVGPKGVDKNAQALLAKAYQATLTACSEPTALMGQSEYETIEIRSVAFCCIRSANKRISTRDGFQERMR